MFISLSLSLEVVTSYSIVAVGSSSDVLHARTTPKQPQSSWLLLLLLVLGVLPPTALPLQTLPSPKKDMMSLLKEYQCPTSPFDGKKKQKVETAESEGGASACPRVLVEVQSSPSGRTMSISTQTEFKLDVLRAFAFPTPPDQVAGNYVSDYSI